MQEIVTLTISNPPWEVGLLPPPTSALRSKDTVLDMKRRKFLVALSALPFLGFLKPGDPVPADEPTKIPGLERVRVGDAGSHIEFGESEPILNVRLGNSPEAVELIWCWKSNGNRYRAYTLLVNPEYAEREWAALKMKKGSLVVDELEISRVVDVPDTVWKP